MTEDRIQMSDNRRQRTEKKAKSGSTIEALGDDKTEDRGQRKKAKDGFPPARE
jgi:hypothetical protein